MREWVCVCHLCGSDSDSLSVWGKSGNGGLLGNRWHQHTQLVAVAKNNKTDLTFSKLNYHNLSASESGLVAGIIPQDGINKYQRQSILIFPQVVCEVSAKKYAKRFFMHMCHKHTCREAGLSSSFRLQISYIYNIYTVIGAHYPTECGKY